MISMFGLLFEPFKTTRYTINYEIDARLRQEGEKKEPKKNT